MTRLASAILIACSPLVLHGQQGGSTHVLLITGLSGEPQYARMFAAAAGTIFDAARAQWHVRDSSLVYLAEDPAADPSRIGGKATREQVAAAFASLARRARPGDIVFIFLLGHGSGELEASTVNLPGPDPTAADYASWLAPLGHTSVVFVNGSSASGDFARILAGPNRVIVTATKTALERNESIFARFFANAITGTEADADKDGRVSVIEAFNYARAEVARAYEASNRMLTEHAMIADSSGIAARITFGGVAASTDLRVIALVGERRVIEARIDSLRREKAGMDSVAYQGALERMLLLLAAKTQAIKSLQRVATP